MANYKTIVVNYSIIAKSPSQGDRGMTIATYKTISSTIAVTEKLPALDYREAISKVASVALRGWGWLD